MHRGFGAKAHVVANCIISTGDPVLLYPSQIERIPFDGEHREDVHDSYNDQFQRPSGIDNLSPNWKLQNLSIHICAAEKKEPHNKSDNHHTKKTKFSERTRLYTVTYAVSIYFSIEAPLIYFLLSFLFFN